MKNIKRLHLTSATIILFVLFITSGTIYGFDSVITGKNDPRYDVENIQTAVDKGGSITGRRETKAEIPWCKLW